MKDPSGVNPSFTEVNATTELLLNVNLLKKIKDDDKCIAPGASITDFNIWDRSMSVEEMVAWTECRFSLMKNYFFCNSGIANFFISGAILMATL